MLKGLVLCNIHLPDSQGGMSVNLSAHDDAHPIEGVRFENVMGYGPVKTSGKVDFTVVPDLVVYEGGPIAWGDEPLTFKGPWDLTTHGTIAVDVENTSKEADARLTVGISEMDNSRCRMTMIPAGFKGTVEIDVCPRLEHPEIPKQMKLMRTNPFMCGNHDTPYDARKLPYIALRRHWSGASTAADGATVTVLVSRVVAKDTSKRKWPAWYAMDEKAFFPFVDRYGQFKYRDWPRKVRSDADLKAAREAGVFRAATLTFRTVSCDDRFSRKIGIFVHYELFKSILHGLPYRGVWRSHSCQIQETPPQGRHRRYRHGRQIRRHQDAFRRARKSRFPAS